MEGGFWKVDQDFNPILRLKNVLLNQALSVNPILYFADGTPYPLPVITLEPAGVAQVNIRIALQSVRTGQPSKPHFYLRHGGNQLSVVVAGGHRPHSEHR
jgi:hypothetical protein